MASMKRLAQQEEMSATLKLIQQVTSSILDKKAVSISKATPHITRIAAKKKLVVPKSAIKSNVFLKPNILVRKPETSIDEADEDAEEEDEEDPKILKNLDQIMASLKDQKEKCMTISWRLQSFKPPAEGQGSDDEESDDDDDIER